MPSRLKGSACERTQRQVRNKLLSLCPLVAFLAASPTAHAQIQVPPPAAASASASTPAIVGITAVQVEGNTLLSQQVLDALTAPAIGPNKSLGDLRDAAARVQAAYGEAGYGGVIAFVPEQNVAEGRVLIRVLEGKIANVRVKGNQHFSEQNVRAALPRLREGSTPFVRAIDRDIQLSNENPAKEVRVTLGPGARPGEIDADVTVQDMNPLQLLLAANNTGSAATGRARLAVGLRHSNLTDNDDVATVQYQTSPQHPSRVQITTLGYHFPVSSLGGSVDVFYVHSNVDNGITATPIGALSFVGKGNLLSTRFNYGLERRDELDQRVSFGIDYKDFQNDCSLGSFGAAACGAVGVSVRALPLSLGYSAQREAGDGAAWGVSTSIAVNAGGSAATTFDAARTGATRHYVIGRLAAFGEFPLDAAISLGLKLDAQYTPHALIAGERFGLGGLSSVRGYEERELTGDWGLGVRADLKFAAFDTGADSSLRLRPLVFVDAGQVGNRKEGTCRPPAASSCTVASVGVGLRATFGNQVAATFDVGRALRDAITTARGDARVHVSLTVAY